MSSSDPDSENSLPAYSVRVSNRAKHLQLKVSAQRQIEVVVPKGVALHYVPGFVAQHKQWIEKILAQIKPQQHVTIERPNQIALNAVDEHWHIDYQTAERSKVYTDINSYQLIVWGQTEEAQISMLRTWLTEYGKRCLIPWLIKVSEELLLPFKKAAVRAQKTRWGSCSAKQHISLNRALLFMSSGAVRYLFIHELCHTKHLNHSVRFWNLVQKYEPEYKTYEKELRYASQVIPAWAKV